MECQSPWSVLVSCGFCCSPVPGESLATRLSTGTKMEALLMCVCMCVGVCVWLCVSVVCAGGVHLSESLDNCMSNGNVSVSWVCVRVLGATSLLSQELGVSDTNPPLALSWTPPSLLQSESLFRAAKSNCTKEGCREMNSGVVRLLRAEVSSLTFFWPTKEDTSEPKSCSAAFLRDRSSHQTVIMVLLKCKYLRTHLLVILVCILYISGTTGTTTFTTHRLAQDRLAKAWRQVDVSDVRCGRRNGPSGECRTRDCRT